jgi:hypothetical protein
VQVTECPHDLLEFLPGRDTRADLGLQRLRHIEGMRPPGRAPEAQGEMGTMLRPRGTVTPRPAAAAVGFGEGAKDNAGGELAEPPQQRGS